MSKVKGEKRERSWWENSLFFTLRNLCVLCVSAVNGAVVLACIVLLTPEVSNSRTAQHQEAPPIDVLITWLDDPSTAWLATVRLQQAGERAIPALLAPGRTQLGPHGRFSPRMVALAKIGEPVIPYIRERLAENFKRNERTDGSESAALMKVIGTLGPAAIPTLVEIAAKGQSWIVSSALDEIVALEPLVSFYGQDLNPWFAWRPQDDRLEQIARHITPFLPRIEEIMDREAKAWRPQGPAPQRSAAYLLARWRGGSRERERGLKVLEGLGQTNEPFYYHLQSVILLHRLKSAGFAQLLKDFATRIPVTDDLKDQYLLSVGIALFKIGDQSYVDFITTVLQSTNRYARLEGIRFAARAGDLRLVPPLIGLLGVQTPTGSQTTKPIDGQPITIHETVGDLAAASLQRLTFRSIARDSAAWQAWWERHQESSYSKLLTGFLDSRTGRIKSFPIWEANRLIEDLVEISDPLVIPLFREYLDRPDLDANKSGPNSFTGGGGDGPGGNYCPKVVTSLLRFAQLGHTEGRSLLEHAMQVVDPEVRLNAALAVGSYDRRAAIERLALEMDLPDQGFRKNAADFLLRLEDARGVPVLIDLLESTYESSRQQACRDLRLYTQQPLPCDGSLPAVERATNVKRWRMWWSSISTFEPKGHEAKLDSLASPEVIPVSYRPDLRVR